VVYDGTSDILGDEAEDKWGAVIKEKIATLSDTLDAWTHKAITPVDRAGAKVGKIAVKARYHKLPRTIEDDLRQTTKILGTGLNGAVRLAESRTNTNYKYAIKSLQLDGRKREDKERLIREMEIFLSLDHPRIARLFDVYESKHRLDLVMEHMEGGELFDRIANKKASFLENDAADAVWQMLLALNYMHTKGLVHRDIKLENFLYAKKDGNLLKLIDFGFSKVWDPNANKTMALTCGTLSYMAPEVLKRAYTSKCDLWSLGVVAFSLLMGYMPFHGAAQYQATCIEQGKYKLKPEKWDQLSEPAQDFLKSLLQVDENKRLTAEEALHHRWVVAMKPQLLDIESFVYDALKSFSQASKFRRCCMAMMAWSLSYEERHKVSAYFTAMDRAQDGHISREELYFTLHEKFNADEEEVQHILDAMDSNCDEEIHYSDFLAAMVSTKIELHDEILMSTFKKFDIDRTGYITVRNLRTVLGDKYHGVKVKTLLNELELANSNRISYPEFEDFLRQKPLTAPSRKISKGKSPEWLSCFPCCSV